MPRTFRHRRGPSVSHPLALAAALVVACSPPTLPDPEVSSVDPARVWNGADIPVVVTGNNFLPQIDVDAGGYGTDLDDNWVVDLVGPSGRGSLAGVTVEDARHLLGVLPAGLTPGDYRVELTGPGGQFVASDEPLLEVSENQEVGLRVSYFDDPATTYAAGERVRFLFEAVGFDDEPVLTDVPVQITLTGASVDLVHTNGFELVEILPLNEGEGFLGVLPDGQALLPVDLLAPGRLDVVAASAADTLSTGTLTLFVEEGSGLPAVIELPEAGFEAQAGVPFSVRVTVYELDGKTVLQEPVEVELQNACGTFRQSFLVTGPTVIDSVEVTKLTTGTSCEEDAVLITDGAVGQSEGFEVVGGPPNELFVVAVPAQAPAGQPLVLTVLAQDAEGNFTGFTGDISIRDDLGSLELASCVAAEQAVLCTVVGSVAGDDITVTVDAGGGLTGRYEGLAILPGEETGSFLVSGAVDARAGQSVEARVQPLDAFGNAQDPEVVGTESVVLSDELGDVVCAAGGIDGQTGEQLFTCTFTVARDDAVLTAAGLGATSDSLPFTVDNGVLGAVAVTAPASVQAGDSFQLGLAATDAYGNPYLRQDDPVIDLADDLAGLTLGTMSLDVGGQGVATAELLRAGTTSIRAAQAGLDLGASDPIDVSAGPTDALAVTASEPWAYVGTAVAITVESVDVYGNRTSVSDDVTLSSRQTTAPDLVLGMVNGLAAGDFTWTDPTLSERLDAITDGGVEGSSALLYVVRTCVDGPAAALTFGGFPEARACFDEGAGEALVSASLGGTVAGAAPLFGYGIAAEGQPAVIDTQSDLEVSLPSVGASAIRALAVGSDGCADEAEGVAWVGLDDGSVTGPIELTTSAVDVATFDQVGIDILGAQDCARDIASYAEVRLRTTAGDLGPVSTTGSGLAVLLDALGEGSFDLLTAGGLSGGELEVHAWVGDGSARGLLALPIIGDEIRPTILSQEPSGEVLEPVSEVVLGFSEPLLPGSVSIDRFVLDGPAAVDVDEVVLSPDGHEVTVVLDAPADGALGTWTLTVSRDLRDLAGQRLAGAWGDLAVDYVGSFGDVGADVSAVTCGAVTPSGQRFAPDGDDGVADEADQLSVDVSSSFAPAWWVVTVTDEGGAVVYQDWEVPLAPVDSWAWDGRDLEGFVVPNGTYQVAIAPEDAVGNRGAGCVVQAVVDNDLGTVPGASEGP